MIARFIIAARRPNPTDEDQRTPVVVITPSNIVDAFRLRPGYQWPGEDMSSLPNWCDDFILRHYPGMRGKLHGSTIMDANEYCFAASVEVELPDVVLPPPIVDSERLPRDEHVVATNLGN